MKFREISGRPIEIRRHRFHENPEKRPFERVFYFERQTPDKQEAPRNRGFFMPQNEAKSPHFLRPKKQTRKV